MQDSHGSCNQGIMISLRSIAIAVAIAIACLCLHWNCSNNSGTALSSCLGLGDSSQVNRKNGEELHTSKLVRQLIFVIAVELNLSFNVFFTINRDLDNNKIPE